MNAAQKNRITKEMDHHGLQLAERQLGQDLPPAPCLALIFCGGRYDGDVEHRPHEGEPPEDVWLPSARSLQLESQEDAGYFPASLPVVRYSLVAWSRYDIDRTHCGEGRRWRNYVAVYQVQP